MWQSSGLKRKIGKRQRKNWNKSLDKEEQVEVAILIMNGEFTFDEVMRELDQGKAVEEMKKKDIGK